MEVNEHGVFLNPIKIDFSTKDGGQADVRIGWQDDRFYSACSYHLSSQGVGAAPGIGKYRSSYKTQQEAEEAATEELTRRLTEVMNSQFPNTTDQTYAKQILGRILESRQLTLF